MKTRHLIITLALFLTGTAAFAQTTLKEYLNSSDYRNRETRAALTQTLDPITPEDKLPKVIVNDEGAFILTREKRRISSKEEKFFAVNEGIIYPGALVYVNSRLSDGDPQTAAEYAGGKVQITIDKYVPDMSSTATVVNTYNGVHDQIMKWLGKIGEREGSFSASGSTSYYSSVDHMAIDLKVSTQFLVDAHVNTNVTTNEHKIISVENFSQDFYTVRAEIVDDPTSLFKSNTNLDRLKSDIFKKGPIGFVSSATYGRRAYRFREFHSKDFTFIGDQQVKYGSKFNSTGTENVTNSSKTSKLWGFVQSGNTSDKQIFENKEIDNSNNNDFMKAVTEKTSWGKHNTGVLMNYIVSFVGNQDTAQRNYTDEYYETTYKACPKKVTLKLKKNASQVGGSSIEFTAYYKVIHVLGNGRYEIWDYPKVSKTPQGFADYTHKNFSMGETTYSKDIPTKDVPDINNCYIYDNISWVLKGNHASGQKWEDFDHGEIPLNRIKADETSGVQSVKIEINGSNYGKSKPSGKIIY